MLENYELWLIGRSSGIRTRSADGGLLRRRRNRGGLGRGRDVGGRGLRRNSRVAGGRLGRLYGVSGKSNSE
jgi:hypothetical protein